MEINRHNYEAYLLDLLEGSLSVEDQQKLENFMLLNPDCNPELTELEPWILEGEKVQFQNSRILKKEFPNHSTILKYHNFDLVSIARMEGDLSDEQIAAHQIMVEADDHWTLQWDEWQRTSLQPGPLEFVGKDRLKHSSGKARRVITLTVISAAAAVTLLLVLFRTGSELPQQELSINTSQEAKVQETRIPEARTQQADEVAVQPELEMNVVEVVESQTVQAALVQAHQEIGDSDPNMDATARDDLQAKALKISAIQLSSLSAAEDVVSDQIEPLDIPPVPIHMSSLSIAQIYDLDLQEVIVDYTEEKDISLLKIANAGINGINKLTKSDIALLASRDEEGDVSGFQLKSKRFSFTRPLGREE